MTDSHTPPPQREPILNLPVFVSTFALALLVIHLAREYLLSREDDLMVLVRFAFMPARYGPEAGALPWDIARLWTPFTYSLFHAGWTHLVVNILWLAVFASPLARRIGAMRTLLLGAVASAGGALAHFLAFPFEFVPVIGASAVVTGYMGAASRFVFARRSGAMDPFAPAMSVMQCLSDVRFLAFTGVLLALNLLAAIGVTPGAGGAAIAWQAHVGGLLAGFFAFPLLDRRLRPH
jgi:membrane associated rhomboid family serine protease